MLRTLKSGLPAPSRRNQPVLRGLQLDQIRPKSRGVIGGTQVPTCNYANFAPQAQIRSDNRVVRDAPLAAYAAKRNGLTCHTATADISTGIET